MAARDHLSCRTKAASSLLLFRWLVGSIANGRKSDGLDLAGRDEVEIRHPTGAEAFVCGCQDQMIHHDGDIDVEVGSRPGANGLGLGPS